MQDGFAVRSSMSINIKYMERVFMCMDHSYRGLPVINEIRGCPKNIPDVDSLQ